ncbi:flagellar export chaperone FliS [Geminicoccus harenae]|uniref:flagellar export chaperone FliS n=1 Tax=Geminicoccus harenae TaxID=2498453 RepID=UPI00168AB0B7|nr:flagellar export chaperone FliS [Geminicoccus harenae]
MNPYPQHARAFSAYGQATETLPAARQIVMLYDGIIRRMEEARLACLDGRIEDRWQATQKAARICDALHASLDHDHGGSVATALDRWYAMIGMKIQQVNVSNDPAGCSEVITLVREVRASWDQLDTPATAHLSNPSRTVQA